MPSLSKRTVLIATLGLAACGKDADIDVRDLEMTPEIETVVAGNNQFGMDLYAQAASADGNVWISPFSAYSALGMTLAGARGTTADEMEDVLYVSDPSFHASLGALSEDLDGRFADYQINIADRVFGQSGLGWEDEFLTTLETDYDAGLEEENYGRDADGAREDINAWVSDETDGAIPKLLSTSDITESTKLVLVNAIAFQGIWEDAFDPEDTSEKPFTRADGSDVTTQLMYKYLDVDIGYFEDGRILHLPYKGGEVSLVVVLPDNYDGLPAIEARLSSEVLDGWLADAYANTEFPVGLPKLELRQHLDLSGALGAMGMPTAFTRDADFSGMTQDADLSISGVIQEAWMAMDEKGTTAAAATAVIMDEGDGYSQPPTPFYFNHPGLILLRDDVSGAILFMGRVMDPTAG